MDKNNQDIKSWIHRALNAIQNQNCPKVAAIAREFDILEQQLRA